MIFKIYNKSHHFQRGPPISIHFAETEEEERRFSADYRKGDYLRLQCEIGIARAWPPWRTKSSFREVLQRSAVTVTPSGTGKTVNINDCHSIHRYLLY